MQICIRRGANTIGGSAVELTANTGERIIIDLGQPLDAPENTPDLLPDIPGLTKKTDDLLGILISHPHQDHYALCAHIDKDIPIYMGTATMNIMNVMVEFGIGKTPILFMGADVKPSKTFSAHMDAGKPTFKNVHNFNAKNSFDIGPFHIRAYLMDHSAYDAYAFLIECDGKRILYSGDFRAHGRKRAAYDYFIKHAPKNIDVLLLEGSCLGRESCEEYETEHGLEARFRKTFKSTPGASMILSSSQNIDRLVTIYRACLESGRELVLSSYTGRVLMCLNNPSLPNFTWDGVWRFAPNHKCKHYITADDIAKNPGKYVVFLTHKIFEELKAYSDVLINQDATFIYSMWDGYKVEDRVKSKTDYVDARSVKRLDIHTSGHADIPTLQKFATAVGAKRLVPIHTFYPDEFNILFKNVEPHANNEPFDV